MKSLIARGLAAGLVGTTVMTVVQVIHNKRRGQGPSLAPAKALEKLTGIEPRSDASERRLAQAVHFGYGASWGVVRALLPSLGIRGGWATATLFGLVSAGAALMLPRLGLAPPVREWSREQIRSDALMHGVYALATSGAFRVLAPLRG